LCSRCLSRNGARWAIQADPIGLAFGKDSLFLSVKELQVSPPWSHLKSFRAKNLDFRLHPTRVLGSQKGTLPMHFDERSCRRFKEHHPACQIHVGSVDIQMRRRNCASAQRNSYMPDSRP